MNWPIFEIIKYVLLLSGSTGIILGFLGYRKKRLDFLFYGLIGSALFAIAIVIIDVSTFLSSLSFFFIFLLFIGELRGMKWTTRISVIILFIILLLYCFKFMKGVGKL